MIDIDPQKKEMIDNIVRIEWDMMQTVQGIAGPEACQDDFKTFSIMRFSNYFPWTEELLKSYTQDLMKAQQEGRNLVAEKYGYMMALSDPSYYQSNLAQQLPEVNIFTTKLIREIVAYLLDCEKELEEKYPRISDKGRKLQTSALDVHFASIETYSTGELRTYSPQTLRLFLNFIRQQKAQHHNIALEIRNVMAESYGYQSLEELEEKI